MCYRYAVAFMFIMARSIYDFICFPSRPIPGSCDECIPTTDETPYYMYTREYVMRALGKCSARTAKY